MRTKTGIVVSSKDATVVVKVDRYVVHSKYGKRYRVSKKFHAHDDSKKVAVGETVSIAETAPISKLKRWKVIPKSA